jgi:hypothetical protein
MAEQASDKPPRRQVTSRIISKTTRRVGGTQSRDHVRPVKAAGGGAGSHTPAPRRTRSATRTSTQGAAKSTHPRAKPAAATLGAHKAAGSRRTRTVKTAAPRAIRRAKPRGRKTRQSGSSSRPGRDRKLTDGPSRGTSVGAGTEDDAATAAEAWAEVTPEAWTSVDAARSLAATSAVATVRRVAELEAMVRQLQAQLRSRDAEMHAWKASVRQPIGGLT